MTEPLSVQDGCVVSMDYSLFVEGKMIDSSAGQEPLLFLQGSGNIIRGLEQALYGMAIGQSKQVTVPAQDAYGELDLEAFTDVPRGQFPANIPLEIGLELGVRDETGRTLAAHIAHIDAEVVRLDFNHPLAGKELHFDVTITALRLATGEELEHGHVHHGHDH
jgi:FKBP-type peptidyl-prolyl cis-trans isomerase SlyD